MKEEEYFHNQQILPRKIHSFHSHQRLIHIYIYIYIYINAQPEKAYAAQKSLRDLRPDVVQRRAHKQMSVQGGCVGFYAHNHAHNHSAQPCAQPGERGRTTAHKQSAQPSAQPPRTTYAHNRAQKIYFQIRNSR